MPREARVQASRLVRQREEAVVARSEPDAGADGADVVQRVPDPLELEQDRPRPGHLGRRLLPEQLLAGLRIRDGVRHPARRAGTGDGADAVRERESLACPLDSSVLVEEPRVDVQDPVADDVEAEVARLDHARVDRADGDLVRVVAADGRREAIEGHVVVDERAQRLVAVEHDAVEVVRLALVPARCRCEVDDRRHRSRLPPPRSRRGRRRPGRRAGCVRPRRRRVRRGVEPGEAPAVGERRRHGLAVGGSVAGAALTRALAAVRRRSPSPAATARRR